MRKRVESWGVIVIQPPQGRYAPPEAFRYGITGRIDGQEVELLVTAYGDGAFLSGGTTYEIGEPDSVYEQKFPNARERLMKIFQ